MDTRLVTPDGHNIAAIHESRGASRAVLLCHGITAEKNEGGLYTSFAQMLAEHGLDSFRFDFRGHGESSIQPGNASIAGMIMDLDTVLSHLSERYAVVDIVAASFGASIVLLLAQHVPMERVGRVCFWNPVTDYGATFTHSQMPWARSFFPQGGLHEVLRSCPITIPGKGFQLSSQMAVEFFFLCPSVCPWPSRFPLLVMHGAKDEIVSLQDSLAFVQSNMASDVQFLLFEECSHGLGERIGEVCQRTLDFLCPKYDSPVLVKQNGRTR